MNATDEQNTPDVLIERAVELWCRALRQPKHDNGDKSVRGFFTGALAGLNADAALAKVDDYGAAIERFRSELVTTLKFQRDNEGKPTGKQLNYGPELYRLERSLRVDYHPCAVMHDAAKKAGVPLSAFSWKSSVSIWDDDCVTSSLGYGAKDKNHYPLSDGSWLICELRGGDMPAIIKAVEQGRLPELEVERSK